MMMVSTWMAMVVKKVTATEERATVVKVEVVVQTMMVKVIQIDLQVNAMEEVKVYNQYPRLINLLKVVMEGQACVIHHAAQVEDLECFHQQEVVTEVFRKTNPDNLKQLALSI